MTETPPQAQDDDPRPLEEETRPAEDSAQRETDQPDQPEPADSPPQPPPYRGVYGQQPGTGASTYGRQPYHAPPQGQQPPGYGAQPYDSPPQGQQHPGYGVQSYDPRWGYGPPGNPQHPQPGQPTGDDTTMALFCYIGGLFGSFIVPLILYLIKKNDSRFVRFHAAQALNYGLTQMIVLFSVLVPLAVVAYIFDQPAVLIVLAPVWLYEVISPYVWMILGAIRSNRGEWYTMPKWACFRMVR